MCKSDYVRHKQGCQLTNRDSEAEEDDDDMSDGDGCDSCEEHQEEVGAVNEP